MSEKKVRGSLLNSYTKYIKKKWGGDGLKECAKVIGMNPDDISAKEWYGLELSIKILECVNEKGGQEHIEKCGGEVLQDIGAIAYLIKLSDMGTVLKRATTQGYDSSFNFGKCSFQIIDKNNALIKLEDHSESELMCLAWIGSIMGAMKLKKLNGKVTEKQCQLKGAGFCEFEVHWE